MRTVRPALLLCLFSLIPASLLAQQLAPASAPAPVASDPQAVSLLQKSLAAQTSGASVTDVTLTGTARRIAGSDVETGTATLRATSADDSRIDLSFPSGNRSEIRNHGGVLPAGSVPLGLPSTATVSQPIGAWSGLDGVTHNIAGHNLMTDAAWFFPAFTLGRMMSSRGYTFSYIGPETLDGQPVTHLKALQSPPPTNPSQPGASLTQHLGQIDMFLDPTTELPVTLAFNTHPDNNALIDIPTEIRFSDYRPVNGVQIPFHVQKYLNNGLVLDLQFENAALNSGLAAATFQIQ